MEARVDRSFETEWPELASWLRGALARRGVPFAFIDDVVQETGCRLWGMWDRVDMTRSTRALAIAIASNYCSNERSRKIVLEPVEVLPEVPEQHDVETAGIARLELHRVKRALRQMNDSHRQVLLAEVGTTSLPEATPSALKMLRHRARRRLNLILDSSSAGFVFVGVKMRWASWRVQQVLKRYAAFAEVPTGTVATICAAAIALGTPAIAFSEVTKRGASSPAQGVLLSAGREADRDGWVHRSDVTRDDIATRAERSKKSNAGQHDQIHLHSDGPVQTGAGISWQPREEGDDSLEAPRCSVGPDRKGEVAVRCTAEAGDQQVTLDLRTGIGP